VYKHFGKEMIANLLKQSEGTDSTNTNSASAQQMIDSCYTKLYKGFMEHIDAIDNGVSICESGEPLYHISTSLSARIGQFNPSWNQPQGNDIQNAQFAKALLVAGGELLSHAEEMFTSWWPARSIVQEALDGRFSTTTTSSAGEVVPVPAADGKIIIFSQACPWKDHLFELEAQVSLLV
jgi:uncharacterized UPF0160 family protein